ncbi:hypothetical protein LMTR13_11475 [Bradyrhizobium icense]|uniref:Uncharacterized protein n=1 Tax=Bradyrhizobium icense TaxID=1274631 RepID=A0A1B1UD52_9BRAD|nr:hypothetical protein LMTR13_11475 [Bradyrhizobium icense]
MVEVPALNVRFVVVAASKTLPLLPTRVNVPEPRLIVRVPVPEILKFGEDDRLKVMLGLFVAKSSVPVNAPQTSDWIVFDALIVAATVTVPPPLDPSNVTVSAEDGTLAPLAPPEVADQFAVLESFHVPVPPTQNREAMFCPYL